MSSRPTSSASTPATAARSWPTIVAEALAPVVDPLVPWLRPGATALPHQVADALADSASPTPAADPAPPFLRPEQRAAFGTLLTILRSHGGAMLADPTGTGKTFVALAIANAIAPGRAAAIVPATLRDQWIQRSSALGIQLHILTHEEVSRGRVPPRTTRFVMVDESHRFRNPRTRRYGTLARWLGGRPLLLVTASPVVNEVRELTDQLRLGVRDDTLRPAGIQSLASLGRGASGHPALAELIVARRGPDAELPRVARQVVPWGEGPADTPDWAAMIERLRLSRHRPTAELIRVILWSAALSSPAALYGATRRYARLLAQAHDAARAGQRFTRAELRRFTGPAGGQLVLWELLPSVDEDVDLELGDRESVEQLSAALAARLTEPDPKLEALRRTVADGRRSIVFTTFVETVRWLRTALPGAAWCTGQAAGVGHLRAERGAVLGSFGPDAPTTGPVVLVASDIAAEGLDLQGAERVVHYDLPWTPMRLRQREGRIARLGSRFGEVGVTLLQGPGWLEDRARRAAQIALKSRMDARVGLGEEGHWLWRWRHEPRLTAGRDAVDGGSAAVAGARSELLIGLTVEGGDGRIASHLGLTQADGGWTADARAVTRAIDAARAGTPLPMTDGEWGRWTDLALPHVRRILRDAMDRRWTAGTLTPAARALLSRLRSEARAQARSRNLKALRMLERGIAFVTRGHTVGEEMLIEELIRADQATLAAALARLRVEEDTGSPTLRITGMILFKSDTSPASG